MFGEPSCGISNNGWNVVVTCRLSSNLKILDTSIVENQYLGSCSVVYLFSNSLFRFQDVLEKGCYTPDCAGIIMILQIYTKDLTQKVCINAKKVCAFLKYGSIFFDSRRVRKKPAIYLMALIPIGIRDL